MSNIHALEPQAFGLITFKTTFGDIDIELFTKQCPSATKNFVQLCLDGYYQKTIFERVEKDFIAIGGCRDNSCEDNNEDNLFPDEFHSRLRFTRRGLIATANTKKNENGPKFFFTLGATPELQNKHTIFGRVIGKSIYNLVELNECHVDEDDRPIRTQSINEVLIVENPYPDLIANKSTTKLTSIILQEQTKLDAFRKLCDPLSKPRPEKTKKISYDSEDDSEDDDQDHHRAKIESETRPAISHYLNIETKSTNELASLSSTNKIKSEEHEVTQGRSKATLTQDDEIDAKERRMREIRAQIQSIKKQIESGISGTKREEIVDTNQKRSDNSTTTRSNPKTGREGRNREKETIDLVQNFKKRLKQASKESKNERKTPTKKLKTIHDIEIEEFEAINGLDGDEWLTHKFEADD